MNVVLAVIGGAAALFLAVRAEKRADYRRQETQCLGDIVEAAFAGDFQPFSDHAAEALECVTAAEQQVGENPTAVLAACKPKLVSLLRKDVFKTLATAEDFAKFLEQQRRADLAECVRTAIQHRRVG